MKQPYVVEMNLVPGKKYRLSMMVKRVADAVVIANLTVVPMSSWAPQGFEFTAALRKPRRRG